MLVTECCSESRMRSWTWRGTPEWSGDKVWYIWDNSVWSSEEFRNSPKGVPNVSQNVWVQEHVIWAKGESPQGFWKSQKEVLWSPRARRQGPWRPAPILRKTSFCTFLKPRGLYPLAQIKCSRIRTFRETSETSSDEFQNPSRNQTLLSHISIFISRLFRSSSLCPWSHPWLRTTFGHQHT